MKCPVCGNENSGEALFCNICGQQLTSMDITQEVIVDPKEEKRVSELPKVDNTAENKAPVRDIPVSKSEKKVQKKIVQKKKVQKKEEASKKSKNGKKLPLALRIIGIVFGLLLLGFIILLILPTDDEGGNSDEEIGTDWRVNGTISNYVSCRLGEEALDLVVVQHADHTAFYYDDETMTLFTEIALPIETEEPDKTAESIYFGDISDDEYDDLAISVFRDGMEEVYYWIWNPETGEFDFFM